MAEDPKGAAGADDKKPGEAGAGQNPPNETVPRARLDEVTARAKRAEEERDALKSTQESERRKSLEKNQEFQKLYEEEKGKAAQLGAVQAAMGEYLKAEMEGLTDPQKALVPNLPDHEKVNWVKKAKAAGVFGAGGNPPKTFNNPPANGNGEWWLDLKAEDTRFTQLTGDQYAKWKAHNRKPQSANVRGGF